MDIKETLLKNHSKAITNEVISYVGNRPERFKELFNLYLKGESLVRQRAAWPLSYIVALFPELIRPYFAQLVKYLQQNDHHAAIYRNAFRFLQTIEIPEKYEGPILDVAIKYVKDINAPVAIQAFAMTTAGNIAMKYPELRNELIAIIEDNLPYAANGYKARARKTINQIRN